MTDCMAVASKAMVEQIEKDGEEENKGADMGESSSTADLVPRQALAPWVTMPVAPRFWAVGPSVQLARRGLDGSLRAQGKVHTIQVESLPPAEIKKELVC